MPSSGFDTPQQFPPLFAKQISSVLGLEPLKVQIHSDQHRQPLCAGSYAAVHWDCAPVRAAVLVLQQREDPRILWVAVWWSLRYLCSYVIPRGIPTCYWLKFSNQDVAKGLNDGNGGLIIQISKAVHY